MKRSLRFKDENLEKDYFMSILPTLRKVQLLNFSMLTFFLFGDLVSFIMKSMEFRWIAGCIITHIISIMVIKYKPKYIEYASLAPVLALSTSINKNLIIKNCFAVESIVFMQIMGMVLLMVVNSSGHWNFKSIQFYDSCSIIKFNEI